ncbi:type I polyketide synthase [Actinoallomurus sp. NPDC050550]|uniref:type I polyketide synthase n=1 Tax=Actinoallomurus sp. NPDC050550 TaxID=3154937 RepID=UPI0033FE2174
MLAVIRGSAINQDGASNGLTAPSDVAQERVIAQTLTAARLSPADVDVVEAHGTGTALGDPIEAEALIAAYGRNRPGDRPLWLGSVKTNIGHTHAAAGVAGVIKMVMALRHETLPPLLHLKTPTPHVDWESSGVRLLDRPVAWPRGERVRRAGVSAFGISGTNAHLILEQAPDFDPGQGADSSPGAMPRSTADGEPSPAGIGPRPDAVIPWVLSARSPKALRHQAAALAARVAADPEVSPAGVGWSLASTRSVFEHRAVVLGQDRDGLLAGLHALAAGQAHPDVISPGTTATNGTGPVLVFPGQGSQWAGMGADLLTSSPVFAERLARCERALTPHVDWSVTDVLRGDGAELSRVDVVQPALWAVMVSLAAVWAEHGIAPAAVVGHSQGEIAAACVAGALSLEDGARIVALRSRALRKLAGRGAMAALSVPHEHAARLLGDRPGTVVAAVNGPASTVVSGPPEAVADVVAAFRAEGARARIIEVGYASHGPQVEEIRDELVDVLAGIRPSAADVAYYSAVTGGRVDPRTLDGDYWVTNLRQPVRFADAIEALLAAGHRVFIEASSHPVLTVGMQETFDAAGADAVAIPTLRRDHGDLAELGRSLAQAFCAGAAPDWATLFTADPAPRIVDLPTYAFQRERYWLTPDAGAGDVRTAGLQPVEHGVLPAAVHLPDGGLLLTGRLSSAGGGWPAQHVVAGTVLLPGTALVEWALRAADEADCGGLEEMVLQVPLVLPESGGLLVQVVVGPEGADGRREMRVHSRPDAGVPPGREAGWVCHATGTLGPAAPRMDAATDLGGPWPPEGAKPVEVEDFYGRAAAAGYDYGPAFQGLRAAWRHGTDLLAEVVLPEAAGQDRFGVHPALLDAALHPVFLLDGFGDGGRVWLPFTWSGVSLWATGATRVRVRLSFQDEGSGGRALSVTVADGMGAPVLTVGSLGMRLAGTDRLREAGARHVDGLYVLDWSPPPVPETPPPADDEGWAVLGPRSPGLDGLPHHPDLPGLIAALEGDDGPVPSTVLAVAPLAGDALEATERVLALLQGWLEEPRLTDSRLVVVTRGAVSADGDAVDLAGAAVWGLVRSAQSENPGRFMLFDAGPEPTGVLAAVALAVRSDEPQAAFRDGRLLVPRLVRAGDGGDLVPPPGEPAWRLGLRDTGTVDGVTPMPCPEALEPPAEGQVRIAVHAAGVNFRDVLIVLGMYPGDARFGGSEGAGVVVDVGPGVTGLSVGDRVMGLFEGAFGTYAVADARMLAPVPAGWDLHEAAAVPVAFLTAWYGLVELGGLRRGQSVLIHTATGGVGTAAVRIARHLGAEVYATAGPDKQAVLEEMGVDATHRGSSRDLGFADVVRRTTGGRGVDVVLNSLTGPFVDASLELLSDGGRFVEMGKTDLRDPAAVAGDRPDVRYQAFDLLADAGPERIARMFATLNELFTADALRPPPVRRWPLGRAREALRHMSQARHTGKLVLDVPAPVDPDGTVLITGGTGTIGGFVAEHLVRAWSVGHLLLVSRHGPDAPGAHDLVERLTEAGARVRVVAADVADAGTVDDLIAGIDPAHPLTGVVHAAGVLDNALVGAQNTERLARVWRAKATAALNLHNATAGHRLGTFVLFSSFAAALGTAAQANYAAANAFCDALAAHRQALGLPGVSVAWGLWEEASGLTGGLSEADRARIHRLGITATTTDTGLALFDAAQRHGRPQLLALHLDTDALAGQPVHLLPAPLRTLATTRSVSGRPVAAAGAEPAGDWSGRLGVLPEPEQQRILLTLVRTHAATVLGHADAGVVRADASFKELGFDSLTAVELRNRLVAATGLRLPPSVVFDYPEAAVLAGHLRSLLVTAGQTGGHARRGDPILDGLDRLESALATVAPDDLDTDAVTARLETVLTRWRALCASADDGDAVERLQVADAEQVLDFIDKELGLS